MKKRILIVLFCCGLYSQIQGQSKMGIDGQICISTDAKSLFVNFGGAGIACKFKQFDVSLNMLPSLRFNQEKVVTTYSSKEKIFVRPVLGVAPQFVYRKFIISAPMYYLANKAKWTYTLGIGYKILKF